MLQPQGIGAVPPDDRSADHADSKEDPVRPFYAIALALALPLLASAGVTYADDSSSSAVSGNDQDSISLADGQAVIVSGNQQVVISPTGDIKLNGSPATATACATDPQAPDDGSTVSVESGGRSFQLRGGIVSIVSGGQTVCLNLSGNTTTATATSVPTPQVGPGASLVGQSLQGQNLAGRDLRGSDLTGADLHGADLSNANLVDASLVGADLSGAHLAGADLSQAKLVGSDLTRADLRGAHLVNSHITGADFSGAHLERADLTGASSPDPSQFRDAIVDGSTRLPSR